MKQKTYTIASIIIAMAFWLFDSAFHYIVGTDSFFELVPEESNEFWMRLIIIILIVTVGIIIDSFTNKIIAKEKQIEAIQIYKATTEATHHILNNFIHKMPLFRNEAVRCKDFNQKHIESFDQAIEQATELVKKLSEVENITSENIKASVEPKKDNEN